MISGTTSHSQSFFLKASELAVSTYTNRLNINSFESTKTDNLYCDNKYFHVTYINSLKASNDGVIKFVQFSIDNGLWQCRSAHC